MLLMRHQCSPAALIAFVLLTGANSSLGQTASKSACLSYGPAIVTLSGTLVRKTFPGPPNYESVSKGDKPETALLLDLSKSVCVNEDKAEPDLNPKQTGVGQVQLVLQVRQYAHHKLLIGRRVIATGTLFGEHTGHHHTPILLTVRTLEAAE